MSDHIADLIVKNSNILTVDNQNTVAESFAVKNGRFISVGTDNDMEMLSNHSTKVIDLQGMTIVPGFIDAHIHVLSSGTMHVMAADCDKRTIKEIIQILRTRAKKTKSNGWIQGFKFDDTKTVENRFLTRIDLDLVSKELPVFVIHRAGHVYFLNSKALEISGYTDDSIDPPGGRLGRDADSGRLDGVLYERAVEPVMRLLPSVTTEDRRSGLKFIGGMLSESGLTSVHDAAVSSDELAVYQESLDRDELALRVYMLMKREHFHNLRDSGLKTGFGNDRLKIGGIKMVADGAIAARTALISGSYLDSENGHSGIQAMDKEETEEAVAEIHKSGFQVCIHANGDMAIDMVLSAYEKALKNHPRNNPRHRIEHCTLVNPQLLKRMHKTGTIATPFCTYVYYHGEKMKYYGNDRLEWMFAQKSFMDYGVISTGATDYPPGPFEPLLGIQSCVTRTDIHGQVWGPSQRISVLDALRIYTLNGAYASFEENEKGSIEPGKLADFVVLEKDPTKTDPSAIKDIPINKTVVGGKITYEA
tara:strand:+ start:1081 stop:2676 length:1596 start_codon:yes stop_codon:yes gene_type:complete